MKKWACIKDLVITNVVSATDGYIEGSNEIDRLYDDVVEYDSILIPDLQIGAYFANGVWQNALTDLRNIDYSNQNLTNTSFRDSDLTDCNFNGATITGCDFRGAVGDFSLAGAIWNGQTITHGPVYFPNQYYYFAVTDVFTVMGCVSMPTNQVAGLTPAQAQSSDVEHPGKPAAFWDLVKNEFNALLVSWGM